MRKRSSQNVGEETLTCPVCGSMNASGSAFCDTCGNHFASTTKRDFGTENVHMMALGCTSTIQERKKAQDSFVLLDVNSFLVSRQQRSVLIVILKGLEQRIPAWTIVNDLMSGMSLQKPFSEYLVELQRLENRLSEEFVEAEMRKRPSANPALDSPSSPPIIGSPDGSPFPSCGYLVGILHGKLLATISGGSPRSYILGEKGLAKRQSASENPSPVQSILKNGDYVCICCSDLVGLLGEETLCETVLEARDPQEASENLVRMVSGKRQGNDFSVAIMRIIEVT